MPPKASANADAISGNSRMMITDWPLKKVWSMFPINFQDILDEDCSFFSLLPKQRVHVRFS